MGSDEKPRSKRSRGDRGLFERPKGSGVWWIRYHDETGREHREKVGPKGLARKLYQKRKTEIAERRYFPERIRRRDVRLAAFIDEYLVRVKGTVRSYSDKERHGQYFKAAFGDKTLRELTTGDVERYVARRLKDRAPATVNRDLAFLKRVYNVAIADELVEVNPVARIKLLKENNARARYLDEDEIARLEAAMGSQEWPVAAFALNTGLRRGEQFSLRWDDIDFKTGTITIRRSKSGEARRVPMNDAARAILAALPSRCRKPLRLCQCYR